MLRQGLKILKIKMLNEAAVAVLPFCQVNKDAFVLAFSYCGNQMVQNFKTRYEMQFEETVGQTVVKLVTYCREL